MTNRTELWHKQKRISKCTCNTDVFYPLQYPIAKCKAFVLYIFITEKTEEEIDLVPKGEEIQKSFHVYYNENNNGLKKITYFLTLFFVS